MLSETGLLLSTFTIPQMKHLTLISLLFALPTFAADQPVETDPRLHSDGKGWKLNQATVKDPKRPRVLLIAIPSSAATWPTPSRHSTAKPTWMPG